MQIEELNGANSNAILKKRVWSPALQGLGSEKYLSETQGGTTYYALGDANKNVTEYLDASGNIKAHYEFSPFGKVVTATGTMSGDFNYRFSSEHLDIETGLVYYIYRYYTPELGRWLSRDPISELGGWNLYAMCGNNAVNSCDWIGLGLWPPIIIIPPIIIPPIIIVPPIIILPRSTYLLNKLEKLINSIKKPVEEAQATGTAEYQRIKKEYCCCVNGKKVEMEEVYAPDNPSIGNQVEHCFVGVAIRQAGLSRQIMTIANLYHELEEIWDGGIPDGIQDWLDTIYDIESVSGGYDNCENYDDCVPKQYCKKIK